MPGTMRSSFAGAAAMSIRLPVDELHCGSGSGPWHDLATRSWIPSGKSPALEPGKPLFLKFGSRQALSSPLRQGPEAYKLQILSGAEQRDLQEDLRQIAALPVDQASRLLLTAGTYARRGLYADAIAKYDETLRAQEVPEVRVTLGDLYLASGLATLADREIGMSWRAPDSAAQAAAESGLGRVEYCRKRFADARAHFERARSLYSTLDLTEEAEAARAGSRAASMT